MIRTLWAYLVGIVATVIYAPPIIFGGTSGIASLHWMTRRYPRSWALVILSAAGVRVRVEGGEHLDPAGGQILVANHHSWFDVFAITGCLPVEYCFVAKKELTKVPFFGRAWQAAGHIAIDRQDRQGAIESLEAARRQLRGDGRTIVMFPEGTRSTTGELLPFKKGAFVLALQTGAPVVPMAIVGSREVMPKGSWRIRSGTIVLRVGEPLPVVGLAVDQRNSLMARAQQSVATLAGAGMQKKDE